MGLAKKAELATVITTNPPTVEEAPKQAESGTDAAIARLKSSIKSGSTDVLPAKYKQRDFDAEARGKTRCVQFEAALMSPAIAGMQFNTMEEYLKLVKQAADAGVAYSFQE